MASGETVSKTTARSLVARIVVRGVPGSAAIAEASLFHVLRNQWPADLRVKFLLTPGGFVVADFPRWWSGRSGWDSTRQQFDSLRAHAAGVLSGVVTERVLAVARKKISVLTIGVDLYGDDDLPEAELVALYEVANRRVVWTGKSYPTRDQEDDLVQAVDVKTHLARIAGERVLVLGCNDLMMFSPQAWAGQSPFGKRRRRCEAMRRLARRFKPTVVLHHPHSTDKPDIWRAAWAGVVRQLPSVGVWASGIGYHRWGNPPRSPLPTVLAATQGGVRRNDFIVNVKTIRRAGSPANVG